MPFDGSTFAAATPVTFTLGVFTDTFQVGFSDVDMVRIDLVAGRTYFLDIDNGLDFLLRVFDAFGTEVFLNDDGARSTDNVVNALSPYGEFTPNYTGTYYIAVSPFYLRDYDPATLVGRFSPENPLGISTGTLIVTDQSTNLFPSNGSINSIIAESGADETDALSDRGPQRLERVGAIDTATDVDMARFDLAKGTTVVIDVNGETAGIPNGTVLRIFDDTGILIGFDDVSGTDSDPELIFVAPNFDDYYIGISGDGNANYNGLDGTGTVAGTVGDYEVIIHINPTLVGSTVPNNFAGTDGRDYIVLLAGNDTVTASDSADTVSGGDDADLINGGNGRDVLYGDSGNDSLDGDGGNDVLSGGWGADSAFGDIGSDILAGGRDNDTLLGGAGDDTMRGDDGADLVNGGAGNDRLFGGALNDSLLGADGLDIIDGEDGDDSLNGGTGKDLLNGGVGNDTLIAGTEDDVLLGDSGDDLLLANAGNDSLSGGTGIDVLTGGAGDDSFDFRSTTDGLDTITDFRLIAAAEVINLSAIFAATGSVVTLANLAQFIQCSPSGAGLDSFLAVDADGAVGGLNFTIIAQVNAVTAVELFDISNFAL